MHLITASFGPVQACQLFSGPIETRRRGTRKKLPDLAEFPLVYESVQNTRATNSVLWRSMFRSCFSGLPASSLFLVLFLAFASTAPAQSPTPTSSATVCAVSSEEFLTERLAVWRQRLRLNDWTLTIVASHPGDLKPRTLGHIHWDVEKKIASIRVLDASDYRMACPDALNDMELTVVHELVHLVLSSVSRSVEADRGAEENTVNRIANALLDLARQSNPPETR
jgi:hypothetical protein